MIKIKNLSNKISFLIYVSICLLGAVVAVLAHEMFHIIMHWGTISKVEFFVDGAVVRLSGIMPKGYSPASEEVVAYIITIVVILISTCVALHVSSKYLESKKC